ncbi:MAG: hypothetical protein KatS3mg087_1117 [Patescibacteria group bacterium]|nr:MAG: hypothetical protein KatS3mg087_1117 [Patescibacteria group bacterium]
MSSGEQSSEKRVFTLSDLLIARPCNQAQEEQNWERLRNLLKNFDHFFKIHQVPGESHWRMCIVNLDCLEASRVSFKEATDLDRNKYEIRYKPEYEPALKVSSGAIEDIVRTQPHYDLTDDYADYAAFLTGGGPPPPPPPPPTFPTVFLSQDDLLLGAQFAHLIDYDDDWSLFVGAPSGGYCQCTNCCLYQWDEFSMMWNLIDPTGCELNPPNPPPGGSCLCIPPIGQGNFDGEQRYGTCSAFGGP